MSRVVLVHGIAQQLRGGETLLADWYPALADGVGLAGGRVAREEVSMAFYGDLFRAPGHRGLGVPELTAADVTDELERELLLAWWRAAAAAEPAVPGPEARARARTPHLVRRALNALSGSAFFAGVSERLLVFSARQVRRYFTEPALRARIRDRLAAQLTAETRVVVAHSLGTVVAYEALCAETRHRDLALVTLGSPLGIRNLVFDRLDPAPADGRASWPGAVREWTNVADRGDAVALVAELAPRFGERVVDLGVHNGAKAHDVRPYLTARETGQAITDGLKQPGD
ncbi:hypothetical protein RM844_22855 [Streptomyces sp. DSM 44915]|uniref:Uncharacterized protein n=1 Tax=Streptomyces chisholmiae TaxID=3075540 RepID=A0ABU2JVW2_9ACTN|nr:hypothetical protein [Streptomyces sp. DSM 44915]MDT0269131.1 hypothetical protein [Streptomyces sp. DSM 44915]